MWALVLVAIVVGIIAIQIFVALVALAVSLLGLLVFGIGYGIYYLVAKPETVPSFLQNRAPVVLEESSRSLLRYLTHFYLFIPVGSFTMGVLTLFMVVGDPPAKSMGLGIMAGVVLIGGMLASIFDLWLGVWWGLWEWTEKQTDRTPPIIYDYYGARKLQEINATWERCQEKLRLLRLEHPEWRGALDSVRFELRNYRGTPYATLYLDWENLPNNTPQVEYLLGHLYAAAENDPRARDKYFHLIDVETSKLPRRYWQTHRCDCSDSNECYGHPATPRAIWPRLASS